MLELLLHGKVTSVLLLFLQTVFRIFSWKAEIEIHRMYIMETSQQVFKSFFSS